MASGQVILDDVEPGGKVRLRRYSVEDAEPLWAAIVESTEQVSSWMDWCHPGYSLDESRAWIEHCMAHDAVMYALLRSRHRQLE